MKKKAKKYGAKKDNTKKDSNGKKCRNGIKGIAHTLGFKLRVVPLICIWLSMTLVAQVTLAIAKNEILKTPQNGAIVVQTKADNEAGTTETERAADFVKRATVSVVALQVGTFVIGFIIMNGIASSIIKPLKKLSEVVQDVAEGNLNREIKVKAYGGDVIGGLSESFAEMKDSLSKSIKAIQQSSSESGNMSENLNNNSKQMSMTATEVANAVQEVAKGAEQQASDLVQVSENITMLSGELDKIHDKVSVIKDSNSFTEKKASIGDKQVKSLLHSIDSLKEALMKQAKSIDGLNSRVQEVNNITAVISEISNETNLLALNAAIEAARAGEAGKGFAVVSEQVRKLADQTKNATDDAQRVISTIITETGCVLETSNNITVMMDEQSDTAVDAGSAFNEMLDALSKVGPMIDETYESLKKTIDAKDVIVSSVENVTAVAEEISASAEEISASSEEVLANTEEVVVSAEKMDEIAKKLYGETKKFTI